MASRTSSLGFTGYGLNRLENAKTMREHQRRGRQPTASPRAATSGNLMPRARRGGFVLRRDEHPGQKTSNSTRSPFPRMALSDLRVFVFAERAAEADGAGGSSAAAGSVLARSAARSAQARVCPLRLPAAFRKMAKKSSQGSNTHPKTQQRAHTLQARPHGRDPGVSARPSVSPPRELPRCPSCVPLRLGVSCDSDKKRLEL